MRQLLGKQVLWFLLGFCTFTACASVYDCSLQPSPFTERDHD